VSSDQCVITVITIDIDRVVVTLWGTPLREAREGLRDFLEAVVCLLFIVVVSDFNVASCEVFGSVINLSVVDLVVLPLWVLLSERPEIGCETFRPAVAVVVVSDFEDDGQECSAQKELQTRRGSTLSTTRRRYVR
jgi:hypothetical protein